MKGRVVITGASRGIGRALALRFARRGHPLTLCARSEGDLREVAREAASSAAAGGAQASDVQVVAADLGTLEGRDALVRACPGTLGGLVNNAGFGTAGEFATLDRARERAMLRLNIEAVVDLCHAFLPQLESGSFVMNLSSTAGFQPVPLFATYSASKAFVLSFSEALADELEPRGIRVVALCPGVTETGFQKEADVVAPGALPDEVADFALRALDTGRRVAVHGTMNAVRAFSTRLAPRRVVVKMARKVMEPWVKHR